jgi:hypothetical protein
MRAGKDLFTGLASPAVAAGIAFDVSKGIATYGIRNNAFEEGYTDTAYFSGPDVGAWPIVKLCSDGAWSGSTWDMESLTLHYHSSDGVVGTRYGPERLSSDSRCATLKPIPGIVYKYVITVKTGDDGFDGDVFINFGESTFLDLETKFGQPESTLSSPFNNKDLIPVVQHHTDHSGKRTIRGESSGGYTNNQLMKSGFNLSKLLNTDTFEANTTDVFVVSSTQAFTKTWRPNALRIAKGNSKSWALDSVRITNAALGVDVIMNADDIYVNW